MYGLATTNLYDSLLRRIQFSVLNSSSSATPSTFYTYDAASRLSTVSDGTNTATYSYVANSSLVDHIVFAHNGSAVMTAQNTYDKLNRLTGRSSVSSASSVVNFQYQYNLASQRTKVMLMDGSYWIYGYDALGQLTSAVKYFWDGTPYAGQQFGFTFDTIGNRLSSLAGGDKTGLTSAMRQTGYTNNALNQIVSQNVPGYVDVMGLTLSTNTVKVNGTNAYQKWEYFREQLGTNNGSAPQWVGVSVTAPGQTTISGGEYLQQNPETNIYDLDGNLTSDGRFNYTWDGENRLITMTSLTNAPTASMVSLAFTYDYMGRRIQKVVSTNSGSAWVVSYTNKFVYDGWNVAAILDGSNNVLYTCTWGTDLSGSMQGAGGVGGLISITYCAANAGTNAGTYFPCYDGNGDVVALVNAANGSFAGNWEYGPFGELIRATGPVAKVNPFMFSTKFYDWETGLYYYGYRFYNPSTGRWLSRDPIGECGGKNLYLLGFNHPTYGVDPLGLDWLQNLANFMGGVGDSLTFGLTYQARKGWNWMIFGENDSGVNPQSGEYIGGEVTETVVEIAVTAGGASLKTIAKTTTREALGAARAAEDFRALNKLEGGFVHHITPIKGRPPVPGEFGGQLARYPLPFEFAAQGSWNMKWVPTRAAHAAEHARDLRLEALDRFRESTLLVRQAANEVALYTEGQRPCYDWSVKVSASVNAAGWQDGPIPSDPSMTIGAHVGGMESGTGFILGTDAR